MPQTTLAILAIMLTTFLALSQQRTVLRGYESMVDDEMETMGSGIALQVMEYVGTKAFDEETKDGDVSSTSDLSGSGSFGPGEGSGTRCDVVPPISESGSYSSCDDLDDYHDMEWEEVPFPLRDDTVRFEVSVRVFYMNEDQERVTYQTNRKEVVVRVRGPERPNGRPYMKGEIGLRRTFSYAPSPSV